MSFSERVDQHRTALTKSDRAVVDTVLSYPAESALWRGEELARRAGVHPAAVTRLAQKLGYHGFMELSSDLRRNVTESEHDLLGAGDRFRATLATDTSEQSVPNVLERLLVAEVQALSRVVRHVGQAQLDDVADQLAGARTVYLYARGNATVLLELMDRRLRRFGIHTVTLAGTGRDIAERCLSMSAEDVLLSFAFRQVPQHLPEALHHAQRVGADTVLVTDTLHTIDPAPTTVLSAPRSDTAAPEDASGSTGFATLTVPMLIANAVVLTLAQRHADALLPVLDVLDGLLHDFN